jgi:hypothetical protein
MSSTGRLSPPQSASEAPPPQRGDVRYGEDRLDLLVRDPRCALLVWELSDASVARAKSLAKGEGSSPRYEIRIERRADDRGPAEALTRVDVPDAVGGDRWYVSLPRSGGECRASLGTDSGESFVALVMSSWVPVPPDGPCAEEGAWALTHEARAWLLARARAEREPAGDGSYAARHPAPAASSPDTSPR